MRVRQVTASAAPDTAPFPSVRASVRPLPTRLRDTGGGGHARMTMFQADAMYGTAGAMCIITGKTGTIAGWTVRYAATGDASARALPAATAAPRRRRMGTVRLVTQVYTSRSPSAAAFTLTLCLTADSDGYSTVQYSTVATYRHTVQY